MVKRRKVLIGAGSLLAGGAAATGTGAFSSTEIERDGDVSVVNDANAYLKINGASGAGTAEYNSSNDDGELVLSFDDGANVEGSGINPDSITRFNKVFLIENQSSQAQYVWIEDLDSVRSVDFLLHGDPDDHRIDVEVPVDHPGNKVLRLPKNSGPAYVDVRVDARDEEVGDANADAGSSLMDSYTLKAQGEAEGNPAGGGYFDRNGNTGGAT